MPILTPTVHERLARCNTRVYVSGLVAGANVVLSVDGNDFTHTATSGFHAFTVPPLNAGAIVRAKQDDGSGFTPESPPVIVEDAAVPPTSVPQLATEVNYCAGCVSVTGLVPGCDVTLMQNGTVVGSGRANLLGRAHISLELVSTGSDLLARMIVCGSEGPWGAVSVVEPPPLSEPTIGKPLYECQRLIPVNNIVPGAHVHVERDSGSDINTCSCYQGLRTYTSQELVPGERVRARLYWEKDRCEEIGTWGPWREVEPPDEGIRPWIWGVLVEGQQIIRVGNQISGSELTILIRDNETAPPVEYGPRPAGNELEIALNAPLVAGQQVAVVQELCSYAEQSEWVTVLGLPAEIHAPVIVPPLYHCGKKVQVSGLHAGAVVRVYQDGFVVGFGWAGTKSSLSIEVNTLTAGSEVTAIQWVGGVQSPQSEPVQVLSLDLPHEPRILTPVAYNDTSVWVSGVTPGAHVTIQANGQIIGETNAAEPIVRVGVDPVPGPVQATACFCMGAQNPDVPPTHVCESSHTSDLVTPIVSPGRPGSWAHSGEMFLKYSDFHVPPNGNDGDFMHPVEGQLYYPADASGNIEPDAADRPLVIIAHGYWPPLEDSYLGYGYLAHHLARWGIFSYSINLDRVNELTGVSTEQMSRGEIILQAIQELLNDGNLSGRIDPHRIGLVGHSMSGEGVVAAQVLNLDRGSPFGIRGVVSIAPTNWRPDLQLQETKYLQLYGSRDTLVSDLSTVTGTNPIYGGFRIYDRAWRPKTHFWIYEARHNPFNEKWATGLNLFEDDLVDITHSLAEHQRIARGLINAFFQDALLDQDVYAGYLKGLILPPEVRGFDIFAQHLTFPSAIIDDFGDENNQFGLPEETPLNKGVNRDGKNVTVDGLGMGIWEDVEHVALSHSVHNTRSVELSWEAPTVIYRSGAGGVRVGLTDALSLRIAQFYEDAPVNPEEIDADLFVVVTDGSGENATLRLGSVGIVPYPDRGLTPLTVLRTVQLPIDAFHAANPSLDIGNLFEVSLVLNGRPTGHILVDDLEFVV